MWTRTSTSKHIRQGQGLQCDFYWYTLHTPVLPKLFTENLRLCSFSGIWLQSESLSFRIFISFWWKTVNTVVKRADALLKCQLNGIQCFYMHFDSENFTLKYFWYIIAWLNSHKWTKRIKAPSICLTRYWVQIGKS